MRKLDTILFYVAVICVGVLLFGAFSAVVFDIWMDMLTKHHIFLFTK